MISLNKKQQVLLAYFQENESQRQIAKRLDLSRNTVKKYIDQELVAKQQDTRNLPITNNYVSPPSYKKRKSSRSVLTTSIQKKIRYMIKQNQRKRQQNMHKQQLKIIDMHEKLLDEGFQISYTTVRNFVNRETKKQKEVFIRQRPEAGREIEFDWGEVKLTINGELKSYSLAVFTLPYSNYRFARLYESETLICVQDAHVRCIQHLKFIPEVFTYDNMRTVVKSFNGPQRSITEGMLNLSLHYGFQIRLCEPRKGNQKGHVERSVEVIRRKAFAQEDTFSTLGEAQSYLEQIIQKLNDHKHYQKKTPHRLLLVEERQERKESNQPTPFDAAELVEARVTKYSTIMYRQNHYSVQEGYVGEFVKVKVSANTLRIFYEGECVGSHTRCWGLHTWIMEISHFLKTFEKKKGALIQSECLNQAPNQIKNIFETHYIGNEKDFLALYLALRNEEVVLPRVLKAIASLEEQGSSVTTEKIIFIAQQNESTPTIIDPTDEVAVQSLFNIQNLNKLWELTTLERSEHDESPTADD